MNNTQKLFSLASLAAKNAYAPYSEFAVGAAIYSNNNKFYSGCNVENISYPVGTCAEAGAIAAMVQDGEKIIKEILIFANSTKLITPCGACRQRIAEFSYPDTLVHLANLNGVQKTYTIAELLPNSFSEF
ncbi:MAG: cytidine deaminase [Alphaproteobacteria bacterium]|nr:cytidine deaminase [Alphaproteobacteria bacterium]